MPQKRHGSGRAGGRNAALIRLSRSPNVYSE